jgi:hypothetical protein
MHVFEMGKVVSIHELPRRGLLGNSADSSMHGGAALWRLPYASRCAFSSARIPVVDQQGEEDQWDYDVVVECRPRVVGRIVVGDDDLLYVPYRIAYSGIHNY